jgi:hypothetical protein
VKTIGFEWKLCCVCADAGAGIRENIENANKITNIFFIIRRSIKSRIYDKNTVGIHFVTRTTPSGITIELTRAETK